MRIIALMMRFVFLLHYLESAGGFRCPDNNQQNVCGGKKGPYGIKASPSPQQNWLQFSKYVADTPYPNLRASENQWSRYGTPKTDAPAPSTPLYGSRVWCNSCPGRAAMYNNYFKYSPTQYYSRCVGTYWFGPGRGVNDQRGNVCVGAGNDYSVIGGIQNYGKVGKNNDVTVMALDQFGAGPKGNNYVMSAFLGQRQGCEITFCLPNCMYCLYLCMRFEVMP